MEIEKTSTETSPDILHKKLFAETISSVQLNSGNAINLKVWRFLSAPLWKKKEALYQIGLGSNENQLPPRVLHVLLKCFSFPCDSAFFWEYLYRLHAPDIFEQSPIKELACYIYAQVIIKLASEEAEALELETKLLTYAICFNLAQKYLLDRDVNPDSMAKLLGMQKKALYEREIFILQYVFNFCLKVNELNFERFRTFIHTI